jgi:hypothetical protein
MLIYSYHVLLKEHEADLLSLKIAQLNSPDNVLLLARIQKKEQEIVWIKQKMIDDPDVLKPRVQ